MKQAFFLIAVVIGSTIANAQVNPQFCNTLPEIENELATKYSESAFAEAISQDGKRSFLFYISPSGSFTILMSIGNGRYCMVAAGVDLVFFKPKNLSEQDS